MVVRLSLLLPVSLTAMAQTPPDWVARYDGYSEGFDDARAVVVDAEGSTYVAGSSRALSGGESFDWAILKYDTSGRRVWVRRVSPHPGIEFQNRSWDRLSLLANPDGGVTLGFSSLYGDEGAMGIAKFASDGTLVWETCNQHMVDEEVFGALARDAQGNFCVAGSVDLRWGDPPGFVTAKFAADGTPLWSDTYREPEDAADTAVAIAIGAAGEIYVAGTSLESSEGSTSEALVIMRYSPEGNRVWVDRLHGAAGEGLSPSSAAIDVAGNVFVAGKVRTSQPEVFLMKYHPFGDRAWAEPILFFGRQPSLLPDAAGGTYLGASPRVYKLSPDGDTVWQTDGLADSSGPPLSLALDASGNLYAATSSFESVVLWKHDSSGKQAWGRRHIDPDGLGVARAIAVDDAGNAHVAGTATCLASEEDFLTVTWSPDGEELWSAEYNAPGHAVPQATTLDLGENAVVVGITSPERDFVVVRFDSWGKQLSEGRTRDVFGEIAKTVVDPAGNIFVAGRRGNPSEAVLVKCDPEGNLLWMATHDGEPQKQNDNYWSALSVDKAGDVYVGGCSEVPWPTYGVAVVKYDREGIKLWERQRENAYLRSLVLDSEGNVLTAGIVAEKVFVTKHDTGGGLLWSDEFSEEVNEERPRIALGSDDSIVVASSAGPPGSWIVLRKYDSAGNRLWKARHEGYVDILGSPIELDEAGSIYVGGSTTPFACDFLTLKYDSAGNLGWYQVLGLERVNEYVRDIHLDPAGNVYVGGPAFWESSYGFVFAKYSPAGALLASDRGAGLAFLNDESPNYVGMSVDSGQHVYVVSKGWDRETGTDFVLVKYSTAPPMGDVPFVRGDCNGDGDAGGSLADAIVLLFYCYLGTQEPPCLSACDTNGDGELVGVTDAIYLLLHSFTGDRPPPAPYPDCGLGPVDALGCASHPICASPAGG